MERMQQDMSGFCLTRHIPLLLLLQPERLGFYAKIRAIFGTLLCVNKITAPKIKKRQLVGTRTFSMKELSSRASETRARQTARKWDSASLGRARWFLYILGLKNCPVGWGKRHGNGTQPHWVGPGGSCTY